jgi:hypothetical protein
MYPHVLIYCLKLYGQFYISFQFLRIFIVGMLKGYKTNLYTNFLNVEFGYQIWIDCIYGAPQCLVLDLIIKIGVYSLGRMLTTINYTCSSTS